MIVRPALKSNRIKIIYSFLRSLEIFNGNNQNNYTKIMLNKKKSPKNGNNKMNNDRTSPKSNTAVAHVVVIVRSVSSLFKIAVKNIWRKFLRKVHKQQTAHKQVENNGRVVWERSSRKRDRERIILDWLSSISCVDRDKTLHRALRPGRKRAGEAPIDCATCYSVDWTRERGKERFVHERCVRDSNFKW